MDPPAPFHPTATRRVRGAVRVGVGVIVCSGEGGKFYAGIRKGSHGAGTLALPGGHLEMYESWEACARREVLEEMDLTLSDDDIQLAHVTNDIMREEEKHYVTLFLLACVKDPSQQPKTMEPDKCEGWNAYTWDELKVLLQNEASSKDATNDPKLFGPLRQLLQDEPDAVLKYLGQQQQQSSSLSPNKAA